MVLNCTVQETSFLRWNVDGLTITCSGGSQTGSLCIGSTGVVHAIITEVSNDPNNQLLANITSSLTIHDITEHTAISCHSQVAQVQDLIRVSSM